MNTEPARIAEDRSRTAQNEKQPVFPLAKNRGWPFVLAWLHRLSGIWLVLLSCSVIYFLAAGLFPSLFEKSSQTWNSIVFILWLLVLLAPVLLHASNGGRLILYELFGYRDEGAWLRWMWGLSLLYFGLLVLVALMENQIVSSFIFWLIAFIGALIFGIGTWSKVRGPGHSIVWKWQRISGASLLVMIPAYPLFVFLNSSHLNSSGMIIPSLQNYFIKGVQLSVLLGVLYHGGYGLLSIGWDYVSSRSLRKGLTVLVTLTMLVFARLGIGLIF